MASDQPVARWLIFVTTNVAVLLLSSLPARAVVYEEIPYELRRRLPEFVLRIVPPDALAALSLTDLEEYADAYEENKLRFVSEVRIENSGGPLTPEQAKLVLQIPEGAPFIESRFVRLAKRFYGSGLFSSLEWEVHNNPDTSVDILLWYSSTEPKNIIPDVGLSGTAGVLVGAQYYDAYYKGGDRQLTAGFQLSEEFTDEPRLYASLADSTLNNGRNGYSVSASTGNDWRVRHSGQPNAARIRERVTRVDGSYSWIDRHGRATRRLSVGAGVYHNDVNVLAGDPDAGGPPPPPRTDFDQDGVGEYVSVTLSDGWRDQLFTPKDGRAVVLRAEQHTGDFPFTRLEADVRRYIAAPNILGIKEREAEQFGGRNDIKQFFPAASFAVQLQASLADGDVPWTEEVIGGGSNVVRGVSNSTLVGTKLLAGRAEYRFALDQKRSRELYVFTDHALVGETLDDMEAIDSYGVGGLFRLPVYGGFKAGAYMAQTFDGSESSYGIALGYQF